MTRTVKAICVLIGLLCTVNSFFPRIRTGESAAAENREVKGVWAATVFSLDFPKQPTADSSALKTDIDEMLANAQDMGFNTVFFQVRPAADAFYKSEIFPWSQYLTGSQGTVPQDSFDPLRYAVTQAHAKGMELHAWINPYRVTASAKDNYAQCEQSVAKTHPKLVVEYSDGKLYLNPGIPETNRLITDGVLEIVRNYDVDGIHIDDYFYPGSDFPDAEAFTQYGGKFSDIGDWRRSNISSLIKSIRDALKSEKSSVIFSVSPCGIWANKTSNPEGSQTSGKQAYYDYYADTREWVKNSYVDWIMPQIYWNIGYTIADFEEISRWWNNVAEGTNVKVCAGLAAYKAADETNASSPWYGQNGLDELKRQQELLRTLGNTGGYSVYRLGSLLKNSSLADTVKAMNNRGNSVFSDTPAYPWAEEAIERLHKEGVISGMGDGSFGCARMVSRADFTLMITRMMKKDASFTDNFSDVTADKYYYKEIGIAKALGYASGRGNNTFDPLGSITRQEMAVMTYRILQKEGKINSGKATELSAEFSDANEIAEYARDAVAAMVDAGYLNGYETGEFKPQNNATRAETAVFLDKIAK